jgi:hypothetical protein
VAWTNGDGSLQKQSPYVDVDLPPACAALAIQCNAATAMNDSRRRELYGLHPPYEPNLDSCVRLDQGAESATESWK